MFVFVDITAPAHWASYFINGDASGLDDGEEERAERWMKRESVVNVISTVSDEDEGRFTWSYDLYDPESGAKGGTVLDYTAESNDPAYLRILDTLVRINTHHGRGTITGISVDIDGNIRAHIRKQYGTESPRVTLLSGDRVRFRGKVRKVGYTPRF